MIKILKALFIGARPKTLGAAIAPVVLGFSLSMRSLNQLPNLYIAVPLLITAILIQILTNYVNDLFDFKKGKDTEKRIGPKRVLQSGMITVRAMTYAIIFLTAIIFLFGWYLVSIGGLPIFIIGILSILGAYLYTAGPYPLAYNALGELFVFLFFGPIAVCGTEYMLTGSFSSLGVYFGLIFGGLSSGLLIINNTRDIEEDKTTGKRTLSSLLGREVSSVLFSTALLFPLLLTMIQYIQSFTLLVLLSFSALIFFDISLRFKSLKSGEDYNYMLAELGKVLVMFSFLSSIAISSSII